MQGEPPSSSTGVHLRNCYRPVKWYRPGLAQWLDETHPHCGQHPLRFQTPRFRSGSKAWLAYAAGLLKF